LNGTEVDAFVWSGTPCVQSSFIWPADKSVVSRPSTRRCAHPSLLSPPPQPSLWSISNIPRHTFSPRDAVGCRPRMFREIMSRAPAPAEVRLRRLVDADDIIIIVLRAFVQHLSDIFRCFFFVFSQTVRYLLHPCVCSVILFIYLFFFAYTPTRLKRCANRIQIDEFSLNMKIQKYFKYLQ